MIDHVEVVGHSKCFSMTTISNACHNTCITLFIYIHFNFVTECGETNIELAPGDIYALSSPFSPTFPTHYRESSICQWVVTTSPGNVVFAHFNVFKIEDARANPPYEDDKDVMFGDHLYVGTERSAPSSELVKYTGNDTPLDLETSGPMLVLTFLTDESVLDERWSVTLYSREPEAGKIFPFLSNHKLVPLRSIR